MNILRKPSPHTLLRDDAPDDGLVFTLGTSFAHAVCQFAAQMPLEDRRGVKTTSLKGPVYVCDGCVMGVCDGCVCVMCALHEVGVHYMCICVQCVHMCVQREGGW